MYLWSLLTLASLGKGQRHPAKHYKQICFTVPAHIVINGETIFLEHVNTALVHFLPFRLLPKPLRTNLTKEAAIFTASLRPSSRDYPTANVLYSTLLPSSADLIQYSLPCLTNWTTTCRCFTYLLKRIQGLSQYVKRCLSFNKVQNDYIKWYNDAMAIQRSFYQRPGSLIVVGLALK